MNNADLITNNKTSIGVEFGSTRIKTIMTDLSGSIIAEGSYMWENELIDDNNMKVWSYSLENITKGLQSSFSDMLNDCKEKYGVVPEGAGVMGFSAMMHGYLVFDKDDNLLVPFRTWRNTITEEASDILTKEFGFNVPQRWSISHLYQAILNNEEHIKDIKFITTLAGYIHWKLTGRKVLGIGDASGMFPITDNAYDKDMLNKFNALIASKVDFKLEDILPEILIAGDDAGSLTEEGAKFLDPTGSFKPGVLLCPPEGDAGTGMTATNSTSPRTGNVSAGTSVFAMIVMDKPLSEVHKEIDVVTTPDGNPVAMVHCNNCTSDINAWAGMLKGFTNALGLDIDMGKIYTAFFSSALNGKADADSIISYNYFSGEPVTGLAEGRPLIVRKPNSEMSFENFTRSQLMSALASLKIGMDILSAQNVPVEKIYGHGGYFKTPVAGQKIMAAALECPVTVMETAGEGGAWGIAVLALFTLAKKNGEALGTLGDYLNNVIFNGNNGSTIEPDAEDIKGFNDYISAYKAALNVEKSACDSLSL